MNRRSVLAAGASGGIGLALGWQASASGASMAAVEHRIPRGGHSLYARDYPGADPAFVLMHGFPDNQRIYDQLVPILVAAGRRVVAFDFLGYGQSDKPNGHAYSTKGMTEDLGAVVRTLGLKRVIPVAHDASGPTALNWSLDHKALVAAIALMNVYYDPAPALKFPELISLFANPEYRDLSMAILSDPARFEWLLDFQRRQFLRNAPPALQGQAQGQIIPIVRDQFAASPSVAPAFVALTRDLHNSLAENTRRTPELRRLDVPVGLIWGAGDPYLSIEVARHLKGHFPMAQLTPLRAGHWPQIDLPDDVARGLLAL
jgi:pimeloyl-ACP methyl ester carboxylesterase